MISPRKDFFCDVAGLEDYDITILTLGTVIETGHRVLKFSLSRERYTAFHKDFLSKGFLPSQIKLEKTGKDTYSATFGFPKPHHRLQDFLNFLKEKSWISENLFEKVTTKNKVGVAIDEIILSTLPDPRITQAPKSYLFYGIPPNMEDRDVHYLTRLI